MFPRPSLGWKCIAGKTAGTDCSEFAGMEAAARFESVDESVPLAEIYDKISFEPEGV